MPNRYRQIDRRGSRAHASMAVLRMCRGEPRTGTRGASASAAERAIVGLVTRHLHFEQGARRDIQIEESPGAVDQGPGGNHEATFLLDNADGLAGRTARSPNVLAHHDTLARTQLETAP